MTIQTYICNVSLIQSYNELQIRKKSRFRKQNRHHSRTASLLYTVDSRFYFRMCRFQCKLLLLTHFSDRVLSKFQALLTYSLPTTPFPCFANSTHYIRPKSKINKPPSILPERPQHQRTSNKSRCQESFMTLPALLV